MASVVITPILPDAPLPPIAAPGTVVPELSHFFDQPLFGKPRACVIRQNYNPTIQMQLITPQGEAVSLEETPKLRFCEASLAINKRAAGNITVDDSNYGVVSFSLAPSIRTVAGVYLAEIGVVQNSELVFCNEIYVYVERSSFGHTPYGPPTIDNIRLSLVDSDAIANELLDNQMYSLADVAAAVVRAVQYWNDLPPSSRTFRYSTLNFPHQSLLIEGAQAFLWNAICEQFRKNRLPYAAGGVQLDDQNKIQEYQQAAQMAFNNFKEQAITLKAQMNVRRGFAYYG